VEKAAFEARQRYGQMFQPTTAEEQVAVPIPADLAAATPNAPEPGQTQGAQDEE
jgi:hypothetical protein